jgi:NhaP-type Na+/H+ and K+/H+ antiporter
VPITETPVLSPRDMTALGNLKDHGLFLVEVKITEYSPTLGRRLEAIGLPENTKPLCVVRHGRKITELEALFLEEGDVIYLMTDNESAVRNIFTVIH